MIKLREMHIDNNRLMYSEIRGVYLNDFPDFFCDEFIGKNSITYDEENNGFIIDIRRYTPFQMYYEYEFNKGEEPLNSSPNGPFLLKMEELDKEENIRVKKVILELYKRCLTNKEAQGLKRL